MKIHTGASFTEADAQRLEQDFNMLRKFSLDPSGEYYRESSLSPSAEKGSFNAIQESFLVYNILTSGLDYAVTGYSQYLPYALYEELEQKYFSQLVGTISKYPTISKEEKRNIITAFYLKIAVANANKIGEVQVKFGDEENKDENSVVKLVKNESLYEEGSKKKDFSVNRGFRMNEQGKPIFYDLLYQVLDDSYSTVETGLEEYYNQESIDLEEIAEEIDNKPKAETSSDTAPDGSKFVKFPLFIKKGNSVYMRMYNFGDAIAYQLVGDEKSLETSILDNPLQYNVNNYYNPNVRTLVSDNANLTKYSRDQIDLSYELENNLPFRVTSRSNIYRVIGDLYKVVSFDEKTNFYAIEKLESIEEQAAPSNTLTKPPQIVLPPNIKGGFTSTESNIENIVEVGKK